MKTTNLDVARQALDLTSSGLVGIFSAAPGLDLMNVFIVNGRDEDQLIADLEDRTKAGWSVIALFVWRYIHPHGVQFGVRIFEEYLADPWAQRIFDDFLANYQDVLGRSDSHMSLIH